MDQLGHVFYHRTFLLLTKIKLSNCFYIKTYNTVMMICIENLACDRAEQNYLDF